MMTIQFIKSSFQRTSFNNELKIWSIYFLTIILATYLHELGHCIPAWFEGIRAIPTPAKGYIVDNISSNLQQYISFGGIICTVLVSFILILFYYFKTSKYSSAILAGAIATPGIYSLRFFLIGRGHDATEFQEAQSVVGLNYSGHSLDWIFFALFVTGAAVWIYKTHPTIRTFGRILIGIILTVVVIIGFQSLNNAIFDPIFQ